MNFDAEKNEYIYLGSWYQILKDDINRISGYKQLFYIPAVLGDCIWLPCTFVNALICVDTKKKKERIYFIGNDISSLDSLKTGILFSSIISQIYLQFCYPV